MALIFAGDEAGRNPAIELTDDLLCTVTQELDEPRIIRWLDGQDVD
jgi:hypothetical protein